MNQVILEVRYRVMICWKADPVGTNRWREGLKHTSMRNEAEVDCIKENKDCDL